MIEIKAGQWWRRRDGEIVYVFGIIPTHVYAYVLPVLAVSREGNLHRCTEVGKFVTTIAESPLDLIEHVPDCTGFDWVPEPPKPEHAPWTFETMPIGVRIRNKKSGCPYWIAPMDTTLCRSMCSRSFTYAYLLSDYEQLDGTPCGVLRGPK